MAKQFNIEVRLEDTGERFPVKDVNVRMTIDTLKTHLEIIAGIPKSIQRLMYLDQGDMEDKSTLRHHDIVSGAQITMRIWRAWQPLVEACARGEINKVMSLGVTRDSQYSDPNTNFMSPQRRKDWFLERAFVALYISAHRGHTELMKKLVSGDADVAATTKLGRTALHVAAARGQDACVDLLLSNGAGSLIHKEDTLGKSPLQLASVWNNKSSERRLFLFQWQVRASAMKSPSPPTEKDLMAHQKFDSSLATWLKGSTSQMYCSRILPPQEYDATCLEAKRSLHYYKNVSTKKKKAKKPTVMAKRHREVKKE